MLLLFVYVFGGALEQQTGSIDYVDFITPGVADPDGAERHRLRRGASQHRSPARASSAASGPCRWHPPSVLSGQAVSSTLSNLFSCFIVVVVAFLVGFRPEADAAAWLWFVALLVLFTLATTWLAMVFGLLAKTAGRRGRVQLHPASC